MNYEEELKKNTDINELYLNKFHDWLKEKKLTDKTIRNHVNNAELYINDYLNYYEITKMEDGCSSIGMFLGDWFIRKCMWSTAGTIKSTAASIKKFYQCMAELNYVSQDDYKYLCSTIKERMEDWIEELIDYESDTYSDYF